MALRGFTMVAPADPVSFHAVTRYVQRILLVTVDWAQPPLSAAEIAEAHCLGASTTIDEVKSAILNPAVRLAISLKVPFVRTALFEAKLRGGVVTTIYERRKFERPKLKQCSRKEARRENHKLTRKRKRRPAAEDRL